jgi:protein Tex
VREFADVQPDMVLEGVVTNVTKFGAFVDIGVHQDGLVHISELSNKFIKDPSEAVKAGQIVKVKVLSADIKTKRIALSMKALMGPGQGSSKPKEQGAQGPQGNNGGANRQQQQARPQGKPQNKPQAPKPQTMEEKLAMLSSKWKVS